MYINGTGYLYLNEDSYKFVRPVFEEFGKEEAYNMMANLWNGNEASYGKVTAEKRQLHDYRAHIMA